VLGRKIDDPKASVDLRRDIAYVGEDKRLYAYMTVEQIIQFTRACYTDWRPDVEQDLLNCYQLPRNRKIRALSKGMRTKLALLLALARRPSLLILDEPSDGLDPCGVEQLLESLVSQSSEGTSIFFSSHQIAEVERIADNVCILDKGRLVMDTSMDDVRQSYRQITLAFPEIPSEREFQLAGVERIRTSGHQMAVFASGNADAVVERARDFHATSINVMPVALRDIYLETVRDK
jgi:ABC-2 type transport system ATP-binding protein